MKNHGVLIDTLTRTIMLRDPRNNDAFLVPLSREFDLQNVANAIQPVALADILVVCKFMDVFPDELPGLPPNKDIEFKIELIPSTAPIGFINPGSLMGPLPSKSFAQQTTLQTTHNS